MSEINISFGHRLMLFRAGAFFFARQHRGEAGTRPSLCSANSLFISFRPFPSVDKLNMTIRRSWGSSADGLMFLLLIKDFLESDRKTGRKLKYFLSSSSSVLRESSRLGQMPIGSARKSQFIKMSHKFPFERAEGGDDCGKAADSWIFKN